MNYKTLVNRPKTKKGRETLNRILSAAAQEFYEKGYHNASISDITRLAGVASGTFYVYFDSKYDLYKFLLLQCSHMIRKHLNQAVSECKDRQEAEVVGLREWLRFVQKNRYVYHVIWESLYIDKQLFEEYYKTFSEAYIRGIEAAKRRGEIRSEIRSDVLAWTLMGASSFLGLNWGVFRNQPSEIDRVVENFKEIFGAGVFAECVARPEPDPMLPICIEVEFDDLEEEDDEETLRLERAGEIK